MLLTPATKAAAFYRRMDPRGFSQEPEFIVNLDRPRVPLQAPAPAPLVERPPLSEPVSQIPDPAPILQSLDRDSNGFDSGWNDAYDSGQPDDVFDFFEL